MIDRGGHMKILTRLSIVVVLLTLVAWAIMQEPIESQESVLPQGPQVPFNISGPT